MRPKTGLEIEAVTEQVCPAPHDQVTEWVPANAGFDVLFVSPCVEDAQSLAKMLNDDPLNVVHARGLKDAVDKLEGGSFRVVVTEADLEDGTWLDLLHLTRAVGTELLVTDPWADARFWAEAISLGAYDLLAQPFEGTEVRRVLASASRRPSNVMACASAF